MRSAGTCSFAANSFELTLISPFTVRWDANQKMGCRSSNTRQCVSCARTHCCACAQHSVASLHTMLKRVAKPALAASLACCMLAIAASGAQKPEFLSLPEAWHRGWSAPVYLPELNTFLCTHAKAGCSTLRSLLLIWAGDLTAPHWTSHFRLFSFDQVRESSVRVRVVFCFVMRLTVFLRLWQFNHDFIEVVRTPEVAAKYLKDPNILSVAFVREPLSRLMSMVITLRPNLQADVVQTFFC